MNMCGINFFHFQEISITYNFRDSKIKRINKYYRQMKQGFGNRRLLIQFSNENLKKIAHAQHSIFLGFTI